jgi:hypothetical protein
MTHASPVLITPPPKKKLSTWLRRILGCQPRKKRITLDALEPLSEEDKKEWMVRHIPHRIRAVLPGTPMNVEWAIGGHVDYESMLTWRCEGNSRWEGRLTSMRWLIYFVGVTAGMKGNATRPLVFDEKTDVYITRFKGADKTALFPFGKDAEMLAQVWSGCSKATSHPTNRTNHPKVESDELAAALTVVIPHIQKHVYAPFGKRLVDLTMTMKSEDELLAEW